MTRKKSPDLQQNREVLSESGGPKSRHIRRRTGLGGGVLAIAGLSSLAFAQPTYDVLRRAPEFFAIRELSMSHVVALMVLLAAGPTLALSAPAAVARLLRPAWIRPSVAAPLGLLAGVIGLQAAHGLPPLGAAVLATVVSGGAIFAYVRSRVARSFAMLLSAAVIVAPAILILDRDVRRSLADPPPVVSVADTGARAPVVLAIFDEWPLISILDAEGAIDRERFPNLARFADRATWYPNATAASNMTNHAVPAMLTGSPPERDLLPTAADHPVNLFTLLAPSHDLFAMEPITSLCPRDLNLLARPTVPFSRRLGLLVADLGTVWLTVTLPAPWTEALPPVTQTWSDFNRGGSTAAPTTEADRQLAREQPHRRNANRVSDFRRFVDAIRPPGARPGLYFTHTLLPHAPAEYLPSGRRYRGGGIAGLEDGIWPATPSLMRRHQKRHLLQVQFMDRLIGELIAKLEALDLFDRSVIAIAADHGASFQPGRPHRHPDPTDLTGGQVLDLVAVPMIVKAPFQERAEIDDSPVSVVDLTPRLLDLAGAARTGAPRSPGGVEPLLFGAAGADVEVPADRDGWRHARLAEQAALLGEANDPTAIGAVPELHGVPVSQLPRRDSGSRVRLLNPDAWDDVDLEAATLPAVVVASFTEGQAPLDTPVIVALNGIVADSVLPYRDARGRERIHALLPETLFRAGGNKVELFLASNRQGNLELEHLQPPPTFVFEVDAQYRFEPLRNYRGLIRHLLRHSVSNPAQAPSKLRVLANSPELRGHLVATVPEQRLAGEDVQYFEISGWTLDRANTGQRKMVVTIIGDRAMTAFSGPGSVDSGFSLRAAADREQVEREGIVAFTVGRRNTATRLRFAYLALERGRAGNEIMPISDGRRQTVQPPGDILVGAVDSVHTVGRTTRIRGWAADLDRGEAPRQIVVYRDGKFLTTLGHVNQERPDVAEHFNDPRLLRTGFSGQVPGGPLPSDFSRRHRVFAVMARGAALELPVLPPSGAGR